MDQGLTEGIVEREISLLSGREASVTLKPRGIKVGERKPPTLAREVAAPVRPGPVEAREGDCGDWISANHHPDSAGIFWAS